MVSAIKAEEIFRSVISQSIQSKSVDEAIIGPTIAQFELVCSALIKSRRLQRAHNLIEWMDNLYCSESVFFMEIHSSIKSGKEYITSTLTLKGKILQCFLFLH